MRTLLITMVLMLAGCSTTSLVPLKPYRIDIQQGNYVTQDMVAKLKPGMSRSQVRFALGTPLIIDPFRNDRWDYFYMMHKAGELSEQRLVTIVFSGNELLRIEGDVVAGGAAQPGDAKPATSPAAASEKK